MLAPVLHICAEQHAHTATGRISDSCADAGHAGAAGWQRRIEPACLQELMAVHCGFFLKPVDSSLTRSS
jgi:hypothetical protein